MPNNHLAMLKIKHLHNAFQIAFTHFKQFVRLLPMQRNDMVLVAHDVPGHDVEMSGLSTEFDYAFRVVSADHAQVFPESFTVGWEENLAGDVARHGVGKHF